MENLTTDTTSDSAPAKKPVLLVLLAALTPVLLVILVVMLLTGRGGQSLRLLSNEEVQTVQLGDKLPEGYALIWVRRVELAAETPEGGAWDVNQGAPDPKAELLWQGTRVWEGEPRKNTLVADWEAVGFQLDAGNLISGVELDQTQAVRAARIQVDPKAELARRMLDIRIEEHDLTGSDDVLIHSVDVRVLRIGDNLIELPEGTPVRQLVLRAVPADLPQDEQFPLLTAPVKVLE